MANLAETAELRVQKGHLLAGTQCPNYVVNS